MRCCQSHGTLSDPFPCAVGSELTLSLAIVSSSMRCSSSVLCCGTKGIGKTPPPVVSPGDSTVLFAVAAMIALRAVTYSDWTKAGAGRWGERQDLRSATSMGRVGVPASSRAMGGREEWHPEQLALTRWRQGVISVSVQIVQVSHESCHRRCPPRLTVPMLFRQIAALKKRDRDLGSAIHKIGCHEGGKAGARYQSRQRGHASRRNPSNDLAPRPGLESHLYLAAFDIAYGTAFPPLAFQASRPPRYQYTLL